MITFNELEFKELDSHFSGIQAIVRFDNGYGASVVRHNFSYGNQDGLFELAVLNEDGITYDTPITNDVLGYLSEDEVTDALVAIQELPASPELLEALEKETPPYPFATEEDLQKIKTETEGYYEEGYFN